MQEFLSYEVFRDWCNQRACDGQWSIATASYCITVLQIMQKSKWYNRRKMWKRLQVETDIVNVFYRAEAKRLDLLKLVVRR